MPQGRGSLTAEALRDRTAALASAFVVPLLRHAARPSCGVLWDAALAETRRRLQLLQGCEPAGEIKDVRIRVRGMHMVLGPCVSLPLQVGLQMFVSRCRVCIWCCRAAFAAQGSG